MGDKEIGIAGRPVSYRLQVSGEPESCKNKNPLVNFSPPFHSKCP